MDRGAAPVNCEAFARWLDDGAPDAGAAPFLAHAATCSECAAALDAERAIAATLVSAAAAPAGFTDRVMAHVAATERAATARATSPTARFALPWWAQAAAHPAAALAFAVAALTAWGADRLTAGGLALFQATAERTLPVAAWSPPEMLTDPVLVLGFGLALLPFVAWASLRLFRWSEHAVSVHAPRAGRASV